jgi:hypothetical protein
LLLEEARLRGIRTNGSIHLRLGLTHEQLAQMIGTSREIVTSILNNLRLQAIIDYKGNRYSIFPEKLEQFLGLLAQDSNRVQAVTADRSESLEKNSSRNCGKLSCNRNHRKVGRYKQMKNKLPGILLFLSSSILGLGSSEGQGPSHKSEKQEKPKLLQIGPGTKPFDVTRHAVDLDQIFQGGPPRDGIPALVDPKFVNAVEARKFLRDKDKVLGVVENGIAKAYPLKILTYHEVANDLIGTRPIAVTY